LKVKITMQCELEKYLGELVERIPQGPAGYTNFVFSKETFPKLPAQIASDKFVIRMSGHNYSGWATPRAIVFMSRRASRLLGLLLLAQCFPSANTTVSLEFTDVRSKVKRLIIPPSYSGPSTTGLTLVAQQYVYYPERVQRDPPWVKAYGSAPINLPSWYWSDSKLEWDDYFAKSDTRDSLHEASGLEARIELGNFFLNFGRRHSKQDEFRMEGPAGFQSVGPTSVEIEGWLPNTFGWDLDGC
jgi:hypothetical protein